MHLAPHEYYCLPLWHYSLQMIAAAAAAVRKLVMQALLIVENVSLLSLDSTDSLADLDLNNNTISIIYIYIDIFVVSLHRGACRYT